MFAVERIKSDGIAPTALRLGGQTLRSPLGMRVKRESYHRYVQVRIINKVKVKVHCTTAGTT
jgi:hypothetical protein